VVEETTSMAFHVVRYSNAQDHDLHEQSFPTQKDAVEFVEKIESRYQYIWLLEWGIYRVGGKKLTGYIYYWWSRAVSQTNWRECPDAGWGRPTDRKYLIEYQPLMYKSKRFAHLNVRASPTGNRIEAPSTRGERRPDGSQQQLALVDSDNEPVTRQSEA
jgi:hypothetical protein